MKALGLLLITMSVFVLWATTPGSRNSGAISVQALAPFFGAYSGALYIAIQLALVYHIQSVRGKWVVAGGFIAGAALGIAGWGLDLWGAQSVHGLSVMRQALAGGSCASGAALGVLLLSGRAVGIKKLPVDRGKRDS